MKVIKPKTFAPAMLAYSSAVETAAAWSSATTYALGAVVDYGQSLYESLQGSNLNKQPDTNPTWWQRLGPDNRHAMFDQQVSTATSGTAPLVVSVNTGAINSAALVGLVGAKLNIWLTSSAASFTSRASTATFVDYQGVLQTAGVNVPRYNVDPVSLLPQGLLIEESRTNSIRNNTMVGAAAGTPGTAPTNWSASVTANGITREIVGTGSEDGINYVDIRFSGTATANSNFTIAAETNTQVVASTGQQWTGAIFLRLMAGSYANLTHSLFLNGYTAAGAFDANAVTITYTYPIAGATNAALRTQRYVHAATLNSATTARVNTGIFASYNNGAAIDITLRIGLPQLELGAFATSVIPTTTVAVTRAADVASVNTLSPWFNATQGTLYAEYSRFGAVNFQTVAIIGEPTFNNQYFSGFGSGAPSNNHRFDVTAAGVSQASITILTNPALNTVTKTATAYAVNDFAATANGAVPGTDTSGSLPSGTTLMSLGCNTGLSGGFLNGYLRRITYYPRALSSAELQTLTT